MCGASPGTISRIRLLVPGSRSRGAVGTKKSQLRGAFETTAGWSRDLIAKDLTGGTSSGEIAQIATAATPKIASHWRFSGSRQHSMWRYALILTACHLSRIDTR